MDKIEFKFSTFRYGHDDFDSDVVEIFVNGKNFLDTVKIFDKWYAPIIPEYLYTDLIESHTDEPIFVYDCGCGCSGCGPFCVFVDVGKKTVTWYDFMTEQEYFDDVCNENNFAMLRERLKNQGGLPSLVFDKKQYFKAVGVLRDWIFNKNFNIIFNGIECGYLELIFKTPEKSLSFTFDEMINDPMPQFVELFNYIQKCIAFDRNYDYEKRGINVSIGYDFETTLGDMYYDKRTVLKISAKHSDFRNIVVVENCVGEVLFRTSYLCIEWAEMFKKLFSDLLYDKYFPYSYPCFWYICEDTDDAIFDSVEEELEKLHPDWNMGDILNFAVANWKFSLSDRNKNFFEKYKKMLSEYIIPDRWFEE